MRSCLRAQVVEQQLSDIKKLEAGVAGFPLTVEVLHAPKAREYKSLTGKSEATATAQPHSSGKFEVDHKCTFWTCGSRLRPSSSSSSSSSSVSSSSSLSSSPSSSFSSCSSSSSASSSSCRHRHRHRHHHDSYHHRHPITIAIISSSPPGQPGRCHHNSEHGLERPPSRRLRRSGSTSERSLRPVMLSDAVTLGLDR